ncbi:MAG: hypothetical protein CBB92_13925 [Flammeovirgaceae bacterium TMED32]|nr:MAG: hypothetical protein CBB92_13925 [Flammeovirgaceae bacterium TMED32]
MHLFYQPDLHLGIHSLNEEESRHCLQVLRHQTGDQVHITNGKGLIAKVKIISTYRKECHFEIVSNDKITQKSFHQHLAIAPTKQTERMEWFVEKACELGVDEISFIRTKNTERSKLKLDRLEKKTISALKQSKGGFKTIIHPLVSFDTFMQHTREDPRYIATVQPELAHLTTYLIPQSRQIILIGPEGDFTSDELGKALEKGYQSVSLGEKILRTETAGIMSAIAVNLIHHY